MFGVFWIVIQGIPFLLSQLHFCKISAFTVDKDNIKWINVNHEADYDYAKKIFENL